MSLTFVNAFTLFTSHLIQCKLFFNSSSVSMWEELHSNVTVRLTAYCKSKKRERRWTRFGWWMIKDVWIEFLKIVIGKEDKKKREREKEKRKRYKNIKVQFDSSCLEQWWWCFYLLLVIKENSFHDFSSPLNFLRSLIYN